MRLDCATAQHIVDELVKSIDADIWIADFSSQVLASNPSSGYGVQPLPQPMRGNNAQIANGFVNLPLCAANEEVGRLIIANVAQYGKEIIQVAHTLAELIIHQQMVFEQMFDRQWVLDKFVSDLLHGRFQRNMAIAREEALLLGIELDTSRVVTIIDIQPLIADAQSNRPNARQATDEAGDEHRQRRRGLLDIARRCMDRDNTNIYSFFDEHRLSILATIDAERPELTCQRIKQSIQTMLNELGHTMNGTLSAGIGAYAAGWQDLPQSYQFARFALETGRLVLGAGHAATAFDLGLAGFVCAEQPAIKSELADYLLRPLLDEPELLETLDTFLQAGLASGLAAEQLHMHRHGLSYRLKKIHKLTGMDPTDFHDAAQLAAARQWHSFHNGNADQSIVALI